MVSNSISLSAETVDFGSFECFFEQTRVGSIRIDSKRLFSFEYSREWLDSPEAFRISISMPLQEGVLQDDTVKSFFSNLLPEPTVRKLISKQLGISKKK